MRSEDVPIPTAKSPFTEPLSLMAADPAQGKHVLVIGPGSMLFSPGNTDSYERQKIYSESLASLTIIGYTAQRFDEIIDGNLRIIPTNSRNRLGGYFDIKRVARKLARDHTFDVVSTQNPFFLGLAGIQVARMFGASFRPQLHIEAFCNRHWRQESLVHWLQYLSARYVIHQCDRIRVVSRRSEAYMDRAGVSVTFIPVSTDYDKFTPGIRKKEYDIIMVGRLVPQKNLFFLLDVLSDLKRTYPAIRLRIIGEGPLEAKLKRYVRRLKLEANVVMEPVVAHDQMGEALAEARVFAMTSTYEGWGLAAIEATFAGTPVVMSDTGCAGEAVIDGQSGTVCAINDRQAFGAGIQRYLDQPEIGRVHAKRAREHCLAQLDTQALRERWVGFLNE